MRQLLVFLTFVFCVSTVSVSHAAAEPRLALLVGNAAYKNSPLRSPVNDVRLMEASLKEAGFTVIKSENASMREMRRLVREFGDRLKAQGGVGLFYFAGYGVQLRGDNYLVSVDSDLRNEDEAPDDALSGNLVLEKMQGAGNRVNILVLDASRANPYGVRSKSSVAGLAGMQPPSGALVAYAATPGTVVADGPGRNSPYTESLARTVRQPGLSVEEVFKQVRTAVRKASNNQQTPWENTALEGQFAFRDGLTAAGLLSSQGVDATTLDVLFWDSVKTSDRITEIQTYLASFPEGKFAALAKARIEEIRKLPPPGVPAAPAPELIGTLLLTDHAYGQRRTMNVAVTERTTDRVVYSSGDMLGKDGKVIQVRVGDVVVRVLTGTLWSVPLNAGVSGDAAIERLDAGFRSRGKLNWKTIALGDGRIRVEASVAYNVRYLSVYDDRAYGPWSAIYSPGREIPDSSSAKLNGPVATRNQVSTEFKPR